MLDRLAATRVFIRAIDLGSFSAAGRELGLSQPTVSKQIASLEAHLGVQLVARSTRALALTADGSRYYERARLALEAFEEAEAEVGPRRAPSGPLKVTCGVGLGRMKIAPRIIGFLNRYPAITIDLELSDRFANLIEEGIDVAIRVGELADSSLIAKRLGLASRICVASPDYIEKHGAPETPADLARHSCIVYTLLTTQNRWTFGGANGPVTVEVRGSFRSNNPDAIREVTRNSGGIALSPSWLFADDLARGFVVRLLSKYEPASLPIHAVMPSARFQPARVKAFVAYLTDEFRLDPTTSDYGVLLSKLSK